jgi:PKD repeat protein
MKIKSTALFLSAFLAASQFVNAQSGGNGTSGNPYQIKTCDDLQAMSKYPTAYWILMNNVDCIATKNGTGQWDSTGFNPVGDSTVRFIGNFNGNCYAVENLYINKPTKNEVGLFGFTDSSASITNVQLLNADITGNNHTGIVIGFKLSTYFDDCMSTGTVNGGSYTGGLIGLSDNYQGTEAAMSNSSSKATVKGKDFTGGVVGKLTTYQGGASYITNCFSTGNVTGNNSTGGVAGHCGTYEGGGAELQYCYATGTISGNDSVGGLVGNMGPIMGGGSDIVQSYFTGSVSGKGDVGGLAGYNGPSFGGGSEIENSYSQGSVTGVTNVGGIIGYEVTTGAGYGVDSCYSTGKVTGTTNAGGFIGNLSNSPAFTTSYWDSTVNITLHSIGNTGSAAGIKPSSTAQMQTMATYLNWNFTTIWGYTAGNFPTLDTSMTTGTCNFPYAITALFSFSPDSTCAGDSVSFTDMSVGPVTSWHWNFGDPLSGPANTSTLQNPKHSFSGIGTYTVTEVASKGTTKDSTKNTVHIYCSVLGVNNLSNVADLTVYPNPGNGVFHVEISSVKEPVTMEVYNVLGEKVLSTTINPGLSQINLKGEPQGVYLYKVFSHNGSPIANGKLVIE